MLKGGRKRDLSVFSGTHGAAVTYTPALAYDFTKQTLVPYIGTGTLSVARTGTEATVVNSSGLLTTSTTANTPRFPFHPVSLQCLGLLIEASRQNSGLRMRDFTQSDWVKTNVTAALTSTGVDGVANSCSRITATADNGTVLQTIISAASNRLESVYVKRVVGGGTLSMTVDGGSSWVDVTSQLTGTDINGFSRCFIPVQNVTNPSFGFRIGTSGDAFDVDIWQNEGTGTNGLFTTPILSAGTVLTRAVETSSASPTLATTGTIFVEAYGCVAAAGSYLELDDGSNNNRVALVKNASNAQLLVRSGGTQQAIIGTQAWANDQIGRLAARYNGSDFAISFNGNTVDTQASGSAPASLTTLRIGCSNLGASQPFKTIRRAMYYTQLLTNTELATLTR